PGFLNTGFESLKKKASTLRQVDKDFAILVVDEMRLRPELRYNGNLDQIDGFEELGFFRSKTIAKSLCLFIVKGLFSNWSIILNYFVSENGLEGDCLSNIILRNLELLQEAGITVRVITCDQGSANRKAFSCFQVSPEKPFFYFNNIKVYCMFDFPHLIKCVRNGLLTTNIKASDGIISFNVLKELWRREHTAVTKLCPKLTRQHIFPKNFEKMKVKFATQLFSRTVHAAIKTVVETDGFTNSSKEDALATANFVEKMDKIFDYMNSTTLYSKNPFCCALQKNSVGFNYIKEFLIYFGSLKFVDSTKKVYFWKGIKITLNALLQLTEEVFAKDNDIYFVMTNYLCQDRLENTFSILRQKGGYNKHPSVSEVNQILAKVMTRKIIVASPDGNCEIVEDDHTFDAVMDGISNTNTISCITEEDDSEIDCSETLIENCIVSYSSTDFDITETELPSFRYFLGYIAFKVLPKIDCQSCFKSIRKEDEVVTAPSELFLFYKNYCNITDFGTKLTKICPHFELLNEVFGRMSNLQPLVICTDTLPQPPASSALGGEVYFIESSAENT
ncbi:uncharacterized protein LOC119664178, partial [Teleopsis dalmanni]|uniref:uncharacterized protein LOC119664178 n=1 Tax=Teleopsis dalmanni TaxID=139649 RepID=UPI0018CF2C43